MNTFLPTSPQLSAQPITNGFNTLTAQTSLVPAALTHTAWDITGVNLISIQSFKFGTITGDCTITLQVSIDGGTNFRDFKTYTNAQIAIAGGVIFTEQIKGTHARLYLNVGTMTGSNGFNVRALI